MDKLTIETPEQVHLEFVLAGIGSRFMAVFLDTVIQLVLFLALSFVAVFAAAALRLAGGSPIWAWAAVPLGIFVINWGYYTLFEILWKGQTPGKRWAGIRVIKESGRSINPFEAMARNLVRFVDWLPGLYAVGVLTMALNAKHRRLGDFVAGTLVVHETSDRESSLYFNSAQQPDLVLPQASQLTLQEAELIETFLARRLEIPAEVRIQNGYRIAEMVAARLGVPAEARPPDNEAFLELLVREFRNRARLR